MATLLTVVPATCVASDHASPVEGAAGHGVYRMPAFRTSTGASPAKYNQRHRPLGNGWYDRGGAVERSRWCVKLLHSRYLRSSVCASCATDGGPPPIDAADECTLMASPARQEGRRFFGGVRRWHGNQCNGHRYTGTIDEVLRCRPEVPDAAGDLRRPAIRRVVRSRRGIVHIVSARLPAPDAPDCSFCMRRTAGDLLISEVIEKR